MPIVMMAIILFVCLIRLSMVQMAVHGAASQVVRQAAAGMYPAQLAVEQAGSLLPTSSAGSNPAVQFAADVLEQSLPAPAGPLLAAVLQGDWAGAGNAAASSIGSAVLDPLLRQTIDEGVIDPERLSISGVSLPDLAGGSDAYLTVELDYVFPLGLPFTKQSIILKERATERVWLADSTPAARGGADGSEANTLLQVVALEPDPLRPGRQAHLTARTAPGSTVSLTVQYKSGTSKAKHLGDAVVGADGLVEWSWLVSGNTTPGVWELVLTASDGTSIARHFVVQKADSDKNE